MALILGIETSTKACSTALYNDSTLLASRFQHQDAYIHAEKLNPLIEELFQESGKSIKNLDAVALSQGPGSYTGLRIGTSSSKGICYALNIPLISINTLKLMAKTVITSESEVLKNDLFIPLVDARRMEVYTAVFDAELNRVESTQAKIIDNYSFSEYLKQSRVFFFGDGMEKIKPFFSNHKNAFFIDNIHPNAAKMGEFINEKWSRKEFEDLAYFEPFYLKDFIATSPNS